MPVKQNKPTFEASDGKEFDTKAEAERHDELVLAMRGFWDARKTLARALAKTQKTADGHPFDFGWHDYWYIVEWDGFPHLHKVEFPGFWYGQEFAWDYDNEAIQVVDTRAEHKRREFRISELYRDKKAAVKALAAVQERRMDQARKELEKLIAETR